MVIDVNLVKEGSSAVATVKGGFRVDPPSDDDAGGHRRRSRGCEHDATTERTCMQNK